MWYRYMLVLVNRCLYPLLAYKVFKGNSWERMPAFFSTLHLYFAFSLRTLTHSFTSLLIDQSFTHSFTYSFSHWLIHSLTYSRTKSLIYSLIHLLGYSCPHLLTHSLFDLSLSHSLTFPTFHSIVSLTHSLSNILTDPFNHSVTHFLVIFRIFTHSLRYFLLSD